MGITLLGLFSLTRVPGAMGAAVAFERGQKSERESRYDEAATQYAKVAERYPDSTLAIARAGIAQYRAGRSHAAAETLSKLEGRQASPELTTEVNAVIEQMTGHR